MSDDTPMADLTPEELERAGLQAVTKMRQRHERGRIEVMQHGSMWMDGEWLYTLDADRLAELVRERDEAVALLRDEEAALRSRPRRCDGSGLHGGSGAYHWDDTSFADLVLDALGPELTQASVAADDHAAYMVEIDAKDAEIERLRDALRDIGNQALSAVYCRRIAIAALDATDGS